VLVKLSPFVHRNNSDGTIDSICTECIMVIATSRLEGDLLEDEDGHKCDAIRLEYLHQVMPILRQ
jgi:hypothetical protein